MPHEMKWPGWDDGVAVCLQEREPRSQAAGQAKPEPIMRFNSSLNRTEQIRAAFQPIPTPRTVLL